MEKTSNIAWSRIVAVAVGAVAIAAAAAGGAAYVEWWIGQVSGGY